MTNTRLIHTPIRRRRKAGIGALLAGLAMLSGSVAFAAEDTRNTNDTAAAQDTSNTNGQNANDQNANEKTASENDKAANENKMAENNPALNKEAEAKLNYCQQHYSSCREATKNAAGVLVFPSVVKADLIVGGSGGKGVLFENGKPTGYYSIGSGSVGPEVGYENASQIYVFPTKEAMNELKKGNDWKVGDTAGVTVMAADANVRNSTGKVQAFIFDAKGLNAGASVDVYDIWKTGMKRPS